MHSIPRSASKKKEVSAVSQNQERHDTSINGHILKERTMTTMSVHPHQQLRMRHAGDVILDLRSSPRFWVALSHDFWVVLDARTMSATAWDNDLITILNTIGMGQVLAEERLRVVGSSMLRAIGSVDTSQLSVLECITLIRVCTHLKVKSSVSGALHKPKVRSVAGGDLQGNSLYSSTSLPKPMPLEAKIGGEQATMERRRAVTVEIGGEHPSATEISIIMVRSPKDHHCAEDEMSEVARECTYARTKGTSSRVSASVPGSAELIAHVSLPSGVPDSSSNSHTGRSPISCDEGTVNVTFKPGLREEPGTTPHSTEAAENHPNDRPIATWIVTREDSDWKEDELPITSKELGVMRTVGGTQPDTDEVAAYSLEKAIAPSPLSQRSMTKTESPEPGKSYPPDRQAEAATVSTCYPAQASMRKADLEGIGSDVVPSAERSITRLVGDQDATRTQYRGASTNGSIALSQAGTPPVVVTVGVISTPGPTPNHKVPKRREAEGQWSLQTQSAIGIHSNSARSAALEAIAKSKVWKLGVWADCNSKNRRQDQGRNDVTVRSPR